MKEIILSADGDNIVYLVPEVVADNLKQYCLEFCDRWMVTSPDAKKYQVDGGYSYVEADFIDYLNDHVFPEQKSVFVKNLGNNIPTEYKKHSYFNF